MKFYSMGTTVLFTLLLAIGSFNTFDSGLNYELSVESIDGQQEQFDLVLRQTVGVETMERKITNLKTPFRQVVGQGEIVIQVRSKSGKSLKGELRGVRNGATEGKTSATSDHLILEAGPKITYRSVVVSNYAGN